MLSKAYFSGIPVVGSSYKTHNIFIFSIWTKVIKKVIILKKLEFSTIIYVFYNYYNFNNNGKYLDTN